MVRMGSTLRLRDDGRRRPPARCRSTSSGGGVVVTRKRRPTIQRTGEPEFELMRRVAGPLMAKLAKNGGRRPGTTDRMSAYDNLDGDYKGDAS